MNTVKQAIAALTVTAASVASAFAAGPAGTAADYGQPAGSSASDRVINIDAGTKYVNVQNGETVQFVVQGKSFTWHFDAFPNETAVQLQKLAPAGFQVSGVEVYVASNPLYRG